jgi:hypothetical protein
MAKSPADRAATDRYDAKTYRIIGLRLRIDDDADILESFDKAKEKGLTNREWVRELYERGD